MSIPLNFGFLDLEGELSVGNRLSPLVSCKSYFGELVRNETLLKLLSFSYMILLVGQKGRRERKSRIMSYNVKIFITAAS